MPARRSTSRPPHSTPCPETRARTSARRSSCSWSPIRKTRARSPSERLRTAGATPQSTVAPPHMDRGNARGTESLQTRRWREMDSNSVPGGERQGRPDCCLENGSASDGEPEVRIQLSPADSLGLAQTRPLPVEKPAVPRGCALAEVGRDTKYCRKCANRRCYLCRAVFQYRCVADVVRGIPGSFPRRSCRWAQIKQSRAASAARARLAADVSGRAALLA